MNYNRKIKELNLKGNPSFGLFSSILALYMGFAGVALFGATAPILSLSMSLTPSEVGLLVAAPSLTGGIFRIPFGAWADSNGGKKSIVVLLSLTLVGLFSLAIIAILYPDGAIPRCLYPLLLTCGAFVGCGVAVFTAGVAHVSYWYPKAKHGTALGLFSGTGGLSSGLVTALIPFGLLLLGFEGVYVIWFFTVFLGFIIYLFISDNSYYFQLINRGYTEANARDVSKELGLQEFPKGKMKKTLLSAAKNSRTWALTAIYFSTFGGSLALTSWLPSFWTLHYELSLIVAGILTGLSSAFSPFMRIFGGYFADKFGGERVSIFALALCLSGSLILSFSSVAFVSAVAIFMMVGGIGISNASIFKLVPVYIEGSVGGASGIIGGVGAMGGFLIPPFLGYCVHLLGERGYTLGFLIYAVLFSICLVIMITLYSIRERLHGGK